jgi:116 kDa U5 small nuclear ribonucleoprotein component
MPASVRVMRQRQSSFETRVQVLGEADVSVKGMLEEFGVYLKPAAFKQDVKPLLKDSCSAVFGSATGLTDMLVQHMPLSRVGTATKVCRRC